MGIGSALVLGGLLLDNDLAVIGGLVLLIGVAAVEFAAVLIRILGGPGGMF
ncbi:hypothetical protein ABZV58_18010 [Nocardia sp. NPDC004654]|uniref:hypothetical protein n=1 Tax=Nocardia sp. NPDC004654 TaxID=3154776 RepID=UPI0033B113A4